MEGIFVNEDIKLYKIKNNSISGYIPITDAYFHAYTQWEPKTSDYIGIAYITGNIINTGTDFRKDDKENKYKHFIYKVFLINIKINKLFMWSTIERPGIWVGEDSYKYDETLIIGDDFTVHEYNKHDIEIFDNSHDFDLYTQLIYNYNMFRGPFRTLYPTLDICLQSIFPDTYKDIQYNTISKTIPKADKEYLDIPIFSKCKYYDKALRRDGFTRTFVEDGIAEFRPCKNSYLKRINTHLGVKIIADKVMPIKTIVNPYLGGFPSRPFLEYTDYTGNTCYNDKININSTPIRFKFGYKFMTYNSLPSEYKNKLPLEYANKYNDIKE